MLILLVLAVILLAAVIVLPSIWVEREMQRHAVDRPDFPGTGGELARHLLDEAGLHHVTVEHTDRGDHYDPGARAVRLSDRVLGGRSVTAVAVAAHEVAHAVQHAESMPLFTWRTHAASLMLWVDRAAMIAIAVSPFVFALSRSPALSAMPALVGFGALLLSVLMHALTLPLEFDASFRRALPALKAGRYLEDGDVAGARRVLRAAALTYVAAALLTLVDIARWIRLFR